MPPFGSLFHMSVYCAEALTKQPELAFAAGTHTESIHMKTADFLDLVCPIVLEQGFVKPGTQKPAWLTRKRVAASDALAEGHAANIAGY